jgi:RHS repeat-associated protein
MSRSARRGVGVHARPILLSLLLGFTGTGIEAIPSGVPLPVDRPAELQPETASAVTCGTHPAFHGHLTASSASTVAVNRITNPNVDHYISNVDTDWSCDTLFRYSGTTWNTTATTGTFKWGNVYNSTSPNCYWLVGTDDFTKANSSTDCPDFIAEYAYGFALSPEGVYQQDAAHDSFGDFSFAHSACDIYLGASVTKTGAAFTTGSTGNRPGAANCDPITLDGQNDVQTVTYDSTAPTSSFTTPAGSPGSTVYRNTTASYNVVRTITEAVAGFGGTTTWKLQRQIASITAPNTCGSFANDPAAGNYTTGTTTGSVSTAQTLVAGKCYRWQANATDRNGNVANQATSATVLVDTVAPATGFATPVPSQTTVISGTSFTVAWSETDVDSGLNTRSIQRRIATYSAGACGSYANDGSASTAVSPLSVSSLVSGKCYQWIQTLTDRAGNNLATTSGTLRIDSTTPSADFSAPDEGTLLMDGALLETIWWTENPGSGTITSRALTRWKGAIVTAGTCAGVTFAVDGTTYTGTSPYQVPILAGGNCFYWVQKLTNSNGVSGATTSGMLLLDGASPTATVTSPEANRALAGIFDVTGVASDAGSFRDYTVDYGAGTAPSSWTVIATSTMQVPSTGLLASWDTRALAGVYTVRLTVREWGGHADTVVTKLVYVENSLRGDENYLTRVPFDLGGGWGLAVGAANGEATLGRDLFSIPSYGPSQALSLTYSSLETTSTGRFGVGWASNLTQYLTFENGFVVWHRADGGRVPFGLIASTWTPLRGHFETLTSAGSEYTVTLKDQTRYAFENSGNGRLKRIENRFGNALTLVWNTSTATATDASGRVMNLSIDSANNRITGVTDSAGRSWSFGYSPTGNDLTSVTDPASKVTTLGYDASHRLTTVTRTRTPAVGSPVTITWTVGYTSGKATSVTDPINASVANTFTYNAVDTVVGLLKTYSPVVRNTTTFGFDAVGLGRAVMVTDPAGFVTTKTYDADSNLLTVTRPVDAGPPIDYQTVTYSYDARGNVASETAELDTTGTVVTTLSWYNPTNDLTFRSEADNDAALKLVTKHVYDGAGHLTSVNVSCTTSGTTPPTDASTCSGAGTQDASTNLLTTYTYTANHELLDETDPLGSVTHHIYDTWGNETSVTANYVSGQPAAADRNVVTARAFDQPTVAGKVGLATSMTDPVGNVTTYAYDALGRQLTELFPGDTTIPALTRTTTFDEFGNLLTETDSWTGVSQVTTFVYDKANRRTSLTDGAGVSTTTAYDAAGNAIQTVTSGATTDRAFDGLGRVTVETTDGDSTTFAYDPSGNERQVVDAAGVTTTRIYDRGGRELSEILEDGPTQLVSVRAMDRLGRTTSSTEPEGAITITTYDRPGRVLTTTTSGIATTNAYDRAGNLLSTKHAAGDVSATVVDALNRKIQTVENCTNSGTTQPPPGVVCTGAGTHNESTNLTTSTYYDASGATVAVKDAVGYVTRSFPNVRRQEWKTIANCTNSGSSPPADPPTCTGAGTADTATNLVSTHAFDGSGATILTIVTINVGDTAISEAAYDSTGRLVASRNALGTVSRTLYDSNGRVTSQIVNCTNTGTTVPTSGWESCAATGTHDATWNVTTAYTYDASGNRETETAPNGRITRYVYDGAGRVIEQTQNYTAAAPAADQNLTTYTEYDPAGRIKAVRAPTVDRNTFVVTAYAYDDAGRVLAEVRNCTVTGTVPPPDPDWRGCGPVWDGVSAWISMGTSDASRNIITSYSYDSHGNRISMTAPDPSDTAAQISYVVTRYAYDTNDRLCRVLEAASVDLQTLADPCSTTVIGTTTQDLSTRYTYDAAGNLGSMVDGRGNATAYVYDAAGRMTTLTDALTHALGWTYDALGRKRGQSNRDGTSVTWTYDGAGRMLTRAATGVATVTYTYDDNGNRLTAADGSRTITTTYDRLNRPLQVTVSDDVGATSTSTYSFTAPTRTDPSGAYTFTIDKFGREISAIDPIHGASVWTSVYRADGQGLSLAAPNGNTTAWTYDTAGRSTGSATTAAGPVTRASYVYALNRAGQRLSEASTITGDPTNGTVTFAYDALGRITSYSGAPVTTQTFAWDKVPNRTSKQVGGGGAVTMTYDVANRPTSDTAGISYSNDLDGRLTGRQGQTLVWDALGRLVQVKDSVTSANISTYTYDPLDRLLSVNNGSGITRFRYVAGTNQIAQARDAVDAVIYSVGTDYVGGARLDYGVGGSNQRYYGVNGHGDLTWTGGTSGSVTATLRSDPWGLPGTSTGAALPSFRFQRSWFDASATLSWALARWYAPGLGRFVSEDTLLGKAIDPPSRNLFLYGDGDPISNWDPDGHQWYRVKSGDTLKTIAMHFYGHEEDWATIFNANRVRARGATAYVGACLWIRWIVGPPKCNQAVKSPPPACGSSGANMFNCITGNIPDPWTKTAAKTLGVSWWNLTPGRLQNLTKKEVGRARIPDFFQSVKYGLGLTDGELAGDLLIRAGGGSVDHQFADMLLVVGNIFQPTSSQGAVTWGRHVFTTTGYLWDVSILSHEYIHVLQQEAGGGGYSISYLVEMLNNGGFGTGQGPENRKEAMAYLWGGWISAFHQYGDDAPWCIYRPLYGGVPTFGC